MAKGRRLTTSRSDRYLETYTSYGNNYGSSSSELTEFGEEDVWSMVDDCADRTRSHEDDTNSEWSPASAAGGERRRVAIPHGPTGGLSLAFDDPGTVLGSSSPRIVHQFHGNDAPGPQRGGRRDMNMASSAPVNVPDWNKIYRVDSVESMHEDSDEDRGLGSEMVPPHVYLARSRKMLATSVFEGQGRTLKGRDMRRVRDAIWSRTGFDG